MKITDITLKANQKNSDTVGYITIEDEKKDEVAVSLSFDTERNYWFYHGDNLYRIEAVKA